MAATRILVVDDEPDFVQLIRDILMTENFAVSVADTGPSAIKAATDTLPDLILLDWNLPGKDGVDVCKILKSDPKTRQIPVIMLTVKGRESDIVLGLEMGADDYMHKRGLRPRELVARVRTALRKYATETSAEPVFRSGKLVLDASKRLVMVGSESVDLRGKEFDLLHLFLQKRGRVLSRNFLTEAVWGGPYIDTSRTMDTTIARLRAKLGKEGAKILSLRNIGYKFEDDPESL